jgi:hypothetical protein
MHILVHFDGSIILWGPNEFFIVQAYISRKRSENALGGERNKLPL